MTNLQRAASEQSNLGSESRGLSLSVELFTSKLLDALLVLMELPSSDRGKLQQMLSTRTRPGLILDIKPGVMHIAYIGQPSGHGTQHKWRLYFIEELKDLVDKASAGSALVNTGQQPDNGSEWGGTNFRWRSLPEVIASREKSC